MRIGLPQRYMFTAMARIRLELERLIDRARAGDRAAATKAALHKALDLELAIMLEAYRDAHGRARRATPRARSATRRSSRRPTSPRSSSRASSSIGLDERGVVRLFNAGAEATTGYGRDEMIGADARDDRSSPDESRESREDPLACSPTNDREALPHRRRSCGRARASSATCAGTSRGRASATFTSS